MKSQPETIISVRSLNVWYNGLQALKDVNADIAKNKVIALIGASGSGKTTFLRSLNRMLDLVTAIRIEGQISIDGKTILGPEVDVIKLRQDVGMVFQNPTPFPKSIYDNIAYGLEILGRKRSRSSFSLKGIFRPEKIDYHKLEASSNEVDATVVKSLKDATLWLEVRDRLNNSAFRLSGGQQQRLCIARAIAVKPKILLMDEPCSELDPISTKKIEELINRLKHQYTVVIVTHNLSQARRISDYTGFFHMGSLTEFGTTSEIFRNPKHKITQEYVRGDFG
jgi:phosphate transport system ATP-binding protein